MGSFMLAIRNLCGSINETLRRQNKKQPSKKDNIHAIKIVKIILKGEKVITIQFAYEFLRFDFIRLKLAFDKKVNIPCTTIISKQYNTDEGDSPSLPTIIIG